MKNVVIFNEQEVLEIVGHYAQQHYACKPETADYVCDDRAIAVELVDQRPVANPRARLRKEASV